MAAEPGRNFLRALRAERLFVRIAIVVASLLIGSPFIAALAGIAWRLGGSMAAFAVLGVVAAGVVWFLAGESNARGGGPAGATSAAGLRYCGACGEVFTEAGCPACGEPFDPALPSTVAELASILNDLTAMAREGRIPEAALLALRPVYDRRLIEARRLELAARGEPASHQPGPVVVPPAAPPPPPAAPPPPPAGSAPAATHRGPALPPPPHVGTPVLAAAPLPSRSLPSAPAPAAPPPPPPEPPGPSLGEVAIGWAAERQADLLLYAGAFLLSISAVIFVAYQGETLSGGIRFSILTIYAVALLGLGLSLSHWERVREAGPVFLALGAILVPVDFVALRTQVLHDDVSLDLLWLIGASCTAVLYLALALRGYGRLYFVPAGTALLAAWAALGGVLDIPWHWWGPWFGSFAAAAYAGSHAFMARWHGLVWALGAATALGVSSLLSAHAAAADDGSAKAALPLTYLIAAAAVAAGLRWRVNVPTLAAMPYLGTMTAASAWWAIAGLPVEWQPAWAAVAANGYIAIAAIRRQHERSWAMLAAGIAAIALVAAHGLALAPDARHGGLPATYAVALVGVVFVYYQWRWVEAAAVIPAVAAATAGAAWWAAFGMPYEWRPLWLMLAGGGYLAFAHLEGRGRERGWAGAALVAGIAAIAIEHGLVLRETADRAPLPIAYAAMFVGLSSAYGRWRWAVPAALMPPVGMLALLATWWATDAVAVEWYAAFVAGAALGYLALAFFDRETRRPGWQAAVVLTGALGVAMSLLTPVLSEPNRWAMPLPAAILLAGAVTAFVRFRWTWRVAPGAIPALVAFAAGSASWAQWNLAPEWYAAFASAASAGYLLTGHFDTPPYDRRWALGALAVSLAAILGPQVAAITAGAGSSRDFDQWSLPVVYGGAAFVAAAAILRWRWRLPEAFAVAPPAVAALGAAVLWVAVDMPLEWLPAWAAAAAATYLVIAPFAPYQPAAWRIASGVAGLFALYAAHALAARDGVDDLVREQLPVAYATLFAGWAWDGYRWRDPGLFVAPLLAAATGMATLWAAGAGPHWDAFPPLAIAAVLAASAPLWRRWRGPDRYGWAYTVAFSALPTLAFLPYTVHHAPQGLATQLVSAGLLSFAAFRTNGELLAGVTGDAPCLDRTVLLQAAASFLFGAAGSANQLFGIEGPDQAWLFAALGTVAWAGAGALGRREGWLWTFAPVGLAGSIIAAIVAGGGYGVLAAVLTLAAVSQAAAGLAARRWAILAPASAFAWLATWAAWQWRELDTAYLSLVYVAFATFEWAGFALLRRRARPGTESGLVVYFLSWSGWAVAALAAGIVLGQRQQALEPGAALVTTREWTLTAAVVAMSSAAVLAEGFRLGRRALWLPASAGLLAALLMAIATREPANVQAYTAPVGVYLIVIALTYRDTRSLIEPHLELHEAVMLIGALHLVLPPAEQSFEPGGGKYGLELIGIGVALLVTGLGLHARWLVAAALLTITATAARLVTGGYFAVPYWAILGIAGTALIGAGLLILSQRAAWDRFRVGVVEWWNSAAPRGT
ncbi:MAG: hypothetical protein IT302_06540 [Dehalococcoidia bacterium]|nr:hypothetical protein [Dehalococcoidia bacterium]